MLSSTTNVRVVTVPPQDEPAILRTLLRSMNRVESALNDATPETQADLLEDRATLNTLYIAFGG